MDMKPVSSSNIAEVGYDSDTQTLRVRFLSGATWDYSQVEQKTFDAMMAYGSVGTYFSYYIKDGYPGSKV